MSTTNKFEAELKQMTDDEVLKVIEGFIANTECKGVEENLAQIQIAYNELNERMSRFWDNEEAIKTQDEENVYDMLEKMNGFC